MSKRNQILTIAQRVLRLEAEAIFEAVDRLDHRFIEAVEMILACKGRVMVSGMGKSGLVGRKIAATFSSLGTPSSFVHPADALHGDLGMISHLDLVLMLSNSGETQDLLRLTEFIKRQGNYSLLITGCPDSTLASYCSIYLDAFVDKEACMHNLAPTSSTALAMAIGDALAVAVSDQRGFEVQDFALFHPGGRLGNRLLRTVVEVMHREPLPCCSADLLMRDVISVMTKSRLGVALVFKGDKFDGIITDGDLRRAFQNGADLNSRAEDLMTPDPICISPESLADQAYKVMVSRKINSLPVIDGESVVGLIQIYDI